MVPAHMEDIINAIKTIYDRSIDYYLDDIDDISEDYGEAVCILHDISHTKKYLEDLTKWRDKRQYYLLLVNFILKPLNGDKPRLGGPGRADWCKEAGGRHGNIVLVKPKDYLGVDRNTGKNGNIAHPAIVVYFDPSQDIVHVAPISHKHPGRGPTIDASEIGIPQTDGRKSLVSVGRPKQLLLSKVRPLGIPRPGSLNLPGRLGHFDLFTVLEHIAAHAKMRNNVTEMHAVIVEYIQENNKLSARTVRSN